MALSTSRTFITKTGISTTQVFDMGGINIAGGDFNLGSAIKLGNASGIITATKFVGDGSDITNLPAGLVNVKTYGAVGDGSTDDRAAIQSAINNAKTVFFPAGSYRVGAALTVWDSYTALIGHESLPEIKVVGTGYSGPPVSVQSSGDAINEFSRIENLKFVWARNLPSESTGGPPTYSSTPNETNCGVSINGSLAPSAGATNRVLRFKMENCRVLGFSNGINLKETTNTLIKRVVIEHNVSYESVTGFSTSNIFCGVNFDGTPGQVRGISPQASVELHNVIVNAGQGSPIGISSMGFRITGQDPRDIFFEGCETAHGNYGWFIDVNDDDFNVDVHINRPIIDTVQNIGIYVKDYTGHSALTINGGYVVKSFDNVGSGHTFGSGIWVENSRGVNITGGIQVLGVGLNNSAHDDGIRFKNSESCSVTAATLMNCRYGISLQDSSDCTVTGNIIGAATGAFDATGSPVLSDGIRVFGNSDNNTIVGNTISGIATGGTVIPYPNGIIINDSTCEENTISSNTIEDASVTKRISDSGTRTNIFDRGFIGISTASGGKLLVGGGTGSSVQFNDSSTRLEIPEANTLAAFTSSVERLRINSTGYVGINSTSPTAYLDIGAHNTGNPTLRVRNHTSAGAFVNNYGSEFRHTFNSMNHGMLIHTEEAADARRTLDISDANGIFATFTNGKFGMGGLTTPSAKLHALDSSSTTTTILKLRNYKSSVNTKPRMAFEASTSANQGANSYIQGLAGTDAAGSNSNNESGLEFIVTYGGSGTERSAMKLDHDGVCTVPRQPKFNIRCNTNNTFGQGGTYNTNYLSPIPTFTPGNRTELTMRAFNVTYPSYAGGNYPKIEVPVDGFYMFGFAGCYFIQNSSDFVGFGFNVNNEGNANTGSPTYLISAAHSNSNYYDIVHNISGSVGIQLSANDYVVLYQWSSTSGRFDGNVHLYGYLVG